MSLGDIELYWVPFSILKDSLIANEIFTWIFET